MTPQQHPIPSGFTAASTTSDVIKGIDLRGRTAIVTGGYSGLGAETVRAFLAAGARVIVPARSVERATAALVGMGGAEVWSMDLLDAASIDSFAERFLSLGEPLYVLVNSAGIMALPERTLDARGYEQQFAVNHLGHFQLALRLWPALKRAGSSRVVSVSSWGHRFSQVHFDDINFERRPYNPWSAYGQSKTANILFAVELDRRGRDAGIRAFALHPGSIETSLGRYLPREILKVAGFYDDAGNRVIDPSKALKTVEQGASTSVWCATSPQLDNRGGVFCENTDIASIDLSDPRRSWTPADSMTNTGVMPYAIDADSAGNLWTLSMRMLNLPSEAVPL